MKPALTDWKKAAGISLPMIGKEAGNARFVISRAKRLNDVPCCSKPDQKTAIRRKSQKMTTILLFSSGVWPPKSHTYTK